MKLKNLRFCLTIMLLIASLIPIVTAPSIQPEPIDSNDDAFITGVGNYFGDTPYLFLRDQTTSLLIGTRFRNVAIPQGEKINNATLYVRSIYDYPAAGDISVTIRGDDIDNSLAFNDSGSFTRTYTGAYVVWNISEVNGNAWHNVTVTNIVQEIIDRVGWQSGNDLSLLFWAIKGTPRREFASVDGNPAYAAYIDINYGIPPPPDEIDDVQDDAPPPYNDTTVWEWEYNDTYRGIDIYKATEFGPPEMILTSSQNFYYYNISWGTGISRNWASTGFTLQSAGVSEIFATQGDWTYFIGHNNSESGTRIYWSDDEFLTWSTSVNINTLFPFLSGRASDQGCMWVDQNGSDTIYIAWMSDTQLDSEYQIIFSNFTRNPVTGNLDFSPDYFNVTSGMNQEQMDPDMYVEKDGTIHIVWQGRNGTTNDVMQYRRRQANGTWLPQVRVSSDDVYDSHEGDVVANEETGVALIVWTRLDVGDWDVLWDVVFPNNTVGTVVGTSDRQRLDRTYVSVVNERESNVAHMMYTSYSNFRVYYTYKTIDNSTAWAGDQRLDIGADRAQYGVIGLDEDNSTLVGVWWDMDDNDNEWNYWNIGTAPTPAENKLITSGDLQYPHSEDYLSLSILGVTWWAVYPNGTLVTPGPVDPDDLKDLIDDLLGGAQPEDPEPDEYKVIDKFRWKLLVLCIGMIMMMGSPLAGVVYGADTATWIKLLFVAFFGLGILWQIKFM